MVEEREQGLEALEVWKQALAFAVRIYRHVLPLFPPEETDQPTTDYSSTEY
jgi:hypothetical protein